MTSNGAYAFASTFFRHSTPLRSSFLVSPNFCQSTTTSHVPVNGIPLRAVTSTAQVRRMPAVIRPVVPSPALLPFVEDKAQSRAVVLKILSAYVKAHNLQDPNNRRIVLCDDKLKSLFGVEQCTILEMSKYVSPHLRKPEDVGGRYLEEAKIVEKNYFLEKENEVQAEKPVTKKKRTRRAASVNDDKKKGQRLFKPVILSDELSAVCRSQKEMQRQEIVKAVWEYIRLNNLQGKPGQPIKCDFLLKKVFNADEIDVRTIMKGISAHVTKKG